MCDDILYTRGEIKRPLICKACENKITYVEQPFCYKCGKPLDDDTKEFCHDCMAKDFHYDRGVAAFAYSDMLKKSMYAFKYNNRREYAAFYAYAINRQFSEIIKSWNAEVLVPVPLHKRKLRKRGYNQALVLAKELSAVLNIPVDDNVIARTRFTTPQKELDDKGRKNNIKNAFQISTNGLKYSKIVLVDDIYTTGTTIDECARILIQGGAGHIYFITACIGNGF